MSYQVFARKYRPQTFDDILGQDHVVQTLRNAIEQKRLAHAYLFVGPRGTGKTSTARILSKALNCSGGPKIDFDPDEDVCREIAEGNSLDVLEIDGASNRGIDEVRELRDNVKFAPTRGQFKIYYIDEVHMLTPQAFNALLKTLEEPPAHVKFIFATTEPTKILPTILSRCQRFDLRRIPEKIIANHLLYIARNEDVTLDPKAAHTIAKGAEGGMRDAQSMLDQLVAFCGNQINESEVLEIFGFTSFETVAKLCQDILTGATGSALNFLHEQSELGKDLSKLLGDLISHLRNVLISKVDPDATTADLSNDLVAILQKQAALIEVDRLLNLIDVFAETDGRMKWAPNKKLHFEVGIIRAVQSLAEKRLNDIVSLLDKSLEGQPAVATPQLATPAAAPVKAATAPVVAEKPSTPSTPPAASTPSPPAASTPSAPGPGTAPASAPASAPAPESKAESPAPEPQESVAAPDANLSGEELWNTLTMEVDRKRPLASAWLKAGHYGGTEGRHFMIGFSEEDVFARDSLIRPNNKAFIEGLLKDLTGNSLTLKVELSTDLAPRMEASFGALAASEPEPEPALTAPAPSEPATTEPGPGPAAGTPQDSAGAKPAETAEPAPEEDFNNDPLIKEALKVFEAEIE